VSDERADVLVGPVLVGPVLVGPVPVGPVLVADVAGDCPAVAVAAVDVPAVDVLTGDAVAVLVADALTAGELGVVVPASAGAAESVAAGTESRAVSRAPEATTVRRGERVVERGIGASQSSGPRRDPAAGHKNALACENAGRGRARTMVSGLRPVDLDGTKEPLVVPRSSGSPPAGADDLRLRVSAGFRPAFPRCHVWVVLASP
jgi:hypothetical protein